MTDADGPNALDRLGWAMRAPLDDATQWRLLVTLTNHADVAGLAWPKVSTLATELHRGDRATRTALDALVDAGYVDRVRLRSGGRMRGYLFRVLVPGLPAIDPDTLPAFAAGVDLPESWTTGIPATTGSAPPVTTGSAPPLDHRQRTAGQEPPTTEPPTEEPQPSTSAAVAPADDEPGIEWPEVVRELTRDFARWCQHNGHPLPSRGTKAAQGWYREMDRLLRLGPPGDTAGQDPPTPDEVRTVMAYAMQDLRDGTGFPGWGAVIRSVGKFREQYSRLRIEATRRNGNGATSKAASYANGYEEAARRLREREGASR